MDETRVSLSSLSTYPEYILWKSYKVLVLSGGGKKGIIELGMLYNLINSNILFLEKIESYVGTSVGSIICFLLLIGYLPIDILQYICPENISLKTSNPLRLFKELGIISIENIFTVIEEVTLKKHGFLPTFIELYEATGKHFVVVTHNISREPGTIYIDYLSHPDLSCIEALKMSCNVPLLFEKYIYDKELYVDGGITDNFPIGYADKKFSGKWILGLSVDKVFESIKGESAHLISYLKTLLNIVCRENTARSKEYQSRNITCIYVSVDEKDEADLNVDNKEKFNMFSLGYQIIETVKKKRKEKQE